MLSTIDDLLRDSRGAVTGTHPVVEDVVSTAVQQYAHAWIRAVNARNAVRYEAPIRPGKLYWVDPTEIERTLSWTQISADRKADEHPRFRQPKYRLAGRVFGGPWDLHTEPLAESTILQSFRAHFQRGVRWKETEFYTETREAIRAGATPWDCQSEGDLKDRCSELDQIFERIASEGYLTQTELRERGETTISASRLDRVIWGEIAVSVGRDGELIFLDGRNRLAMAQIQELESVPVVILVRHENWQRRRDQIVREEHTQDALAEGFETHPDLAGAI